MFPAGNSDGIQASAIYCADAGAGDFGYLYRNIDSGSHAVCGSGYMLLRRVFFDGAAFKEIHGKAGDRGRGTKVVLQIGLQAMWGTGGWNGNQGEETGMVI